MWFCLWMSMQQNGVTIYDHITCFLNGKFTYADCRPAEAGKSWDTLRHWVACEGSQPSRKTCLRCVVTLNSNFSVAFSPPPIHILYLYENCSEKGWNNLHEPIGRSREHLQEVMESRSWCWKGCCCFGGISVNSSLKRQSVSCGGTVLPCVISLQRVNRIAFRSLFWRIYAYSAWNNS